MTDKNAFFSFAENTREQLPATLEKLFAAAHADAVYSKPVIAGNYTIITASEVFAGGGFGSGMGLATAPSTQEQSGGEKSQAGQAGGSGLGGGGGSRGRPVVTIIIGPEGVTIKPVVDVTKIVLAGIAAGIAMLSMFKKFGKARRS